MDHDKDHDSFVFRGWQGVVWDGGPVGVDHPSYVRCTFVCLNNNVCSCPGTSFSYVLRVDRSPSPVPRTLFLIKSSSTFLGIFNLQLLVRPVSLVVHVPGTPLVLSASNPRSFRHGVSLIVRSPSDHPLPLLLHRLATRILFLKPKVRTDLPKLIPSLTRLTVKVSCDRRRISVLRFLLRLSGRSATSTIAPALPHRRTRRRPFPDGRNSKERSGSVRVNLGKSILNQGTGVD